MFACMYTSHHLYFFIYIYIYIYIHTERERERERERLERERDWREGVTLAHQLIRNSGKKLYVETRACSWSLILNY